MYYLVQENIFREGNFVNLIECLDRNKIEYEIIKWIPFSEDIKFDTDRKDVFIFGCVNMTKVAHKYNWVPGVYFNDKHDMENYFYKYGDHMLNSDGKFINYYDELPEHIPDTFFARPSKDSKLFTGSLFYRAEWAAYTKGSEVSADTRIFIASQKSYISREIRCWIVDGKVVTTSLYKMAKRGRYQNYDHEQEAIDFAQKMVDIYAPSRAFVLDICLHEGEYKVVEINCMNCAGFYDANMNKLVEALENMKHE